MEIKRDLYLNRLINRKNNGLIKIVTGIRRSGKSFLLDPIFKNYLLNEGVPQDHIIKIELDRISNRRFHKDPESFNEHIHSMIKDHGQYYLLLDEIQLVEDFESLTDSCMKRIWTSMLPGVIPDSSPRISSRNSEDAATRSI